MLSFVYNDFYLEIKSDSKKFILQILIPPLVTIILDGFKSL